MAPVFPIRARVSRALGDGFDDDSEDFFRTGTFFTARIEWLVATDGPKRRGS